MGITVVEPEQKNDLPYSDPHVSSEPRRVVILGLGNILLSDEGAGVHAAAALRERYSFLPQVEIIDGGTMGLDLLPFLQDADRVLVFDAVDFGKTPGHIEIVDGDAIPSVLRTKLSVHHIGLSDLLLAAKFTRKTPLKISLIGIQPRCLDFGLALTKEIAPRLGDMIGLALLQLREWNIACFRQSKNENQVAFPLESVLLAIKANTPVSELPLSQ